MPGNQNNTQKIYSSRVKVDPYSFVGQSGRLFYNEDTGEIRLSDGITPYGLPVFGGSGGVSLHLYSENGTPIHMPLATHTKSIALGDGSVARSHGAVVQSSGVFSQSGDAQVGSYIARGITTTNAFVEIFLDGVSNRLLVQPNMSLAFTITFIARRTDSFSNEGAVYEISGGIDRSVNLISTRLIGTPSTSVLSEDNPSWDVKVQADTSNGALQILVKGEHGKTIRWVAHVKTVEVTL